MNEQLVLSQITSAGMVVFALQWVKKSKLAPWITKETASLNRVIAWTLAAGTAVGIHVQFDSVTHTLVITGLSLAIILHGLWDWAHAIVMQEMVYLGVQIKESMAATPAKGA